MTSPSEARLEILANLETLARRVADWLLAAEIEGRRLCRRPLRRCDAARAI
jgi:hypothetical protein